MNCTGGEPHVRWAEGNVVPHRWAEELIIGILKDEPNLGTYTPDRLVRYLRPSHMHGAVGGPVDPVEVQHQGALPRAVWAEGRNVAEDEVIKEILAKYGFDPAISDRSMLQAADSYARNLDEAVQRGVFGVPFTIVGDERFWGQDRLEDLDLHLAGKL